MNTVMTRTIKTCNKSGSFSCTADYTPLGDGTVRINECTYDELGILPSGIDKRVIPLAEAQAEYRERKESGWTD